MKKIKTLLKQEFIDIIENQYIETEEIKNYQFYAINDDTNILPETSHGYDRKFNRQTNYLKIELDSLPSSGSRLNLDSKPQNQWTKLVEIWANQLIRTTYKIDFANNDSKLEYYVATTSGFVNEWCKTKLINIKKQTYNNTIFS